MKSNNVKKNSRARSRSKESRRRLACVRGALWLATLAAAGMNADNTWALTTDYSTPSSFSANSYAHVSTVAYPGYPTENAQVAADVARKGQALSTVPAQFRSVASTAQRNANVRNVAAATPKNVPEPVVPAVASSQNTYVASPPVVRIQGNNREPQKKYNAPIFIPKDARNAVQYPAPQISTSVLPEYAPVGARYAQQAATTQNVAQSAPANNATSGRLETLEEAMRVALAESRTQRALALKNGASRANVQAARSLKNPKITNTTSYIGMLNQPATYSDVDLSSVASGIATAMPSLAPILSQFPTQLQVETPLCDKNFVTTVTAVTLPVYLGGRVAALTRAAEAMANATQAGEEVGEQTVKFQVVEAYFLVLRTRQLRAVATEAVQTADSHYADAERMLKVGLVTKNVLLAAQVAASEARQVELKVANAQELAEAAYNRLLWRPLDAPVAIADVDLQAPVGDLENLTAEAIRKRGELQVLAAESRALQEQEKVARADVLPQVALVGAYSYFENSRLNENSNATAAVGMTWTPIDGGTSRARQNAARQNALAMARVRDEAESAIRLQVRQAWLAEKEARERVAVASAAVEQADENLRVVTRGFQEGTLNHTETLDAATMRTAAKSNYENARYDAILAAQRLRYAVGVL